MLKGTKIIRYRGFFNGIEKDMAYKKCCVKGFGVIVGGVQKKRFEPKSTSQKVTFSVSGDKI